MKIRKVLPKPRKLQLQRETVRQLNLDQLRQVVGGVTTTISKIRCK